MTSKRKNTIVTKTLFAQKKTFRKISLYNQSAKYHLQMTRNALQNKTELFAKKMFHLRNVVEIKVTQQQGRNSKKLLMANS